MTWKSAIFVYSHVENTPIPLPFFAALNHVGWFPGPPGLDSAGISRGRKINIAIIVGAPPSRYIYTCTEGAVEILSRRE